jgi:hypothetical protein
MSAHQMLSIVELRDVSSWASALQDPPTEQTKVAIDQAVARGMPSIRDCTKGVWCVIL